MSINYCESELEQAALEWFEGLGYDTAFGPHLAPGVAYAERESYGDIILRGRLREALERINPGLPAEAIEEAVRQVLVPQNPGLLANNRAFHKMVTDGIDVPIRNGEGSVRYAKARLFDLKDIKNNDFLAVNQFTVIEHSVEKRPDIVVFVNGIPLAVFELKSAINEEISITDAYNQLQNYKSAIQSLFIYNSIVVITDGVNARAGTLTSGEDRFASWRTVDGSKVEPAFIPQLQVLIQGMFERTRLLDIIHHFTLFMSDGVNEYKILAGYHQYHAVKKAVASTVSAASHTGDRKIGVVWHTQGSGKSLSMVFYAGELVLSEELENPTIVVITDRNDLDDQLFGTFSQCREILRNTPQQAADRPDLRTLLNNRTSGGVIFTTIHKFVPDEKGDSAPVLTDRRNVIVMADEAHRSQYGFGAEVVKGKDEADVKYGYAKYLRDSLPNASYIGFTGTPVEQTDKNTRAVFGEYIDVYDMTRAVEDKTTVQIFYESRIAKIDLPAEKKPKIDLEYDEITEYQEYTQKEELKRKWARLEAVVGASERLKLIARDIVEHFEKRQASQEFEGGKAMVVCMSRRICVELYREIVKIRPDWHSDNLNEGKIKVVMTGSSSDPADWQPFVGTKSSRETLAKRMKSPQDELQMVIVRDMWLTGFDVPSMHTMYLDKPMQGHNLMQAIARVNRVFRTKKGGLVVDYIGLAENLRSALNDYTESDKKQAGVDADEAADLLLSKLDVIQEMLHGHDYSAFFKGTPAQKMQAITSTMDYIISLRDERKNDYLKLVSELSGAFSLCATTEAAQKVNLEVGFHKAVKAGIVKLIEDAGKKKTVGQLDIELNQLISKSISSGEVVDILQAAGLGKPDISILSDAFLEEVKGMPQKNLAVELLRRLLAGKVRAMARRNLVQSRKFSELLDAAIAKYQVRAIETTQVIMELVELAKEMSAADKRGEETGLSDDELAFYDALASNESARDMMGDKILMQIARELTESIKKDLTVDWSVRDSVQAKMRMTIRRLLKKHGYPPDKTPAAVQIVMEQTEKMCENESVNF